MSMRYFTLSAVCMLVLCMLLALSGTADFPSPSPEIVPPADTTPDAPGSIQSGLGEAMASSYPPAEDSSPDAGAGSRGMTGGDVTPNRPLLLLGFLPIVAWVLLSFRLLSKPGN